MGKTDPYLVDFYLSLLGQESYESAGFFGQSNDNFLTANLNCKNKKYFDLSLDNWNINDLPYNIEEKFDLIVCTRCCYFAKNPEAVLESFSSMLKKDGKILVDWGLGDHWRFEDFKVGWVKNEEQEWCYKEDNFLWSAIWHDSFSSSPEVKKFKEMIKPFGYNEDLSSIIKKEVPVVLNIESLIAKKTFRNIKYSIMSLWPDAPQMYIALVLGN